MSAKKLLIRKPYNPWLMHSGMLLLAVALVAAVLGLLWQLMYSPANYASHQSPTKDLPTKNSLTRPANQTGRLSDWLATAELKPPTLRTVKVAWSTAQPVMSTAPVPILMYHYIRTNPVPTDMIGFGLSVTPTDFSQQMAYLANHGYQSLTVSEVAILVHDHRPLPAHPIVITFDDGYDDLYTSAYPILKQYGLHGEAYIISGKVGSPGYATWSMLRDMVANGVMTVGSHTVDHPHLTTLTSEGVMAELTNSKQRLESELGVKVDDFCYPFGDVNTQVAAEVARAGYRTGTTTAMGWWQPGDNLTTLPRLRVAGGESLASFIARLP